MIEQDLTTQYVGALFLLAIPTFAWFWMKLTHSTAKQSFKSLEGLLQGFAITAVFWSSVIGIGLLAFLANEGSFLHLVLLVLFTNICQVSFIEISAAILSIVWGINAASKGKINYKTHIAIVLALSAIILGAIYVQFNLPLNPFSYP